jgi:hypothetical protein
LQPNTTKKKESSSHHPDGVLHRLTLFVEKLLMAGRTCVMMSQIPLFEALFMEDMLALELMDPM